VEAGSIKIPDGALLFVDHGSRIVECYTDSPTTHVAVVMYEDGVPYVYEAEPPKVRRYRLTEWFEQYGRQNEGSKRKAIITIFGSKSEDSSSELARKKEYLDDQVGRRYSLRGYIRRIPGDGIHCSEMTAEMLGLSRPYAVSPYKLRSIVSETTHVQIGKQFYVEIKPEHQRSWGTRTADWWKDRGRWCDWSCGESWRWCW